jgi:nucleoid DNA-binding protein
MSSAPAKKASTAKPKAAPKTAAKSTEAKAKPVKEPKAPKAEVSKPTAGATLRAKDLVGRVAEATGAKIKDIKDTVEATLAELGKALDAGEALNLPPLGRVKITPAKADAGGAPMKLKLRRGAGGGAGAAKKTPSKEALAEDGEDS